VFIDKEYSGITRRWLNMTKVGQIIQEEIVAAASAAASTAVSETKQDVAREMLKNGEDIVKILKYTGLTKSDVDAISFS
jgi:hypothetical protein